MNPRLSAVIITLNEERNIQACLDSVRFCDEIVIVDSGSKDRTCEIASDAGAKVWTRPFDNFASQKNFGIDKASGDWLLLVDADERIGDALKDEIVRVTAAPFAEGYALLRRNRIFGRVMKYGANAGDVQLRLVRRSRARWEGVVHERVRIDGDVKTLRNPLWHHSTETIADYMKKLNTYTKLEADALMVPPRGRKRYLTMKPLLRFAQLLILKRSWLDGLEGVLFSILSAYYDFISQAKHWERAQHGDEAHGSF